MRAFLILIVLTCDAAWAAKCKSLLSESPQTQMEFELQYRGEVEDKWMTDRSSFPPSVTNLEARKFMARELTADYGDMGLGEIYNAEQLEFLYGQLLWAKKYAFLPGVPNTFREEHDHLTLQDVEMVLDRKVPLISYTAASTLVCRWLAKRIMAEPVKP